MLSTGGENTTGRDQESESFSQSVLPHTKAPANPLAQVFGAMMTLRQESVGAGSFVLDCPLCLLAYNGC